MSLANVENHVRRLSPALPFVGAILVYLVYRFFFSAADVAFIPLGFSPADLHVEVGAGLSDPRSVVARLSWSVTGVFFVLALIASLIVLVRVIAAALRGRGFAVQGAVFGVAVVLAFSCAWFSVEDNLFTVRAFNPILERSFELLEIRHAPVLADWYTGLMLVVTVMLTFAASASLVSPLEQSTSPASSAAENPSEEATSSESPASATSSEEPSSKADHLREQLVRLNTALFIGATMLVAGIVHAIALHKLPGALLNEALGEELNIVVHALSTSAGAIWTFLLLGIYLPAAFTLRRRASELARSEVSGDPTHENVNTWLAENGLSSRMTQQLARIAALLGPLLVGGPAGAFLQLLTG